MRSTEEAESAGGARDLLRESEARERAETVSAVSYDLSLDLRREFEEYDGEAVIRFVCPRSPQDTFLDFTGQEISVLEINGQRAEPPPAGGFRIPLPAALLEEKNEVRVGWRNHYDRHGAGFHRFRDPEDGEIYLFTDFEPYLAHRLFPCFDQPDLKATYDLVVTAPEHWKVVSNGAETSREPAGAGRSRRRFARLPRFSTYLFAVVAGPYEEVRDSGGGVDLGLFTRKALRPFLDPEEIFQVTRQGFQFYEREFDCPYPFGKYDQVFVPEFNAGAMENVACVTFNEANVFRDPPTETQRLRRAEVVLHELAHMWFGNLVTMRWWDGLWLNESFATFISFVALSEATRFSACWEAFLGSIKAWALSQDEKPTTHPIAGSVEDTEQTFLNFDGITYGKGAAVLKQLRAYVGPDAFRNGLRSYFARHAGGNTTLSEFLAPLSETSGRDLQVWSSRWLETCGVNAITPRLDIDRGRIKEALLLQEAGNGDGQLRPHLLHVGLFDAGEDAAVRLRGQAEVLLEGQEAVIDAFEGEAVPDLVWANHDDHAYARLHLDPHSLAFARERMHLVQDPLVRAGLWLTLWDMTRSRRLSPVDFLDVVGRSAVREPREQVASNVMRQAFVALDRYLPPEAVADRSARLFQALEELLGREETDADARLLWARHLITIALGEPEVRRLQSWLDRNAPDGVTVDQGMRWRILTRGCAFGLEDALGRLADEQERDPTDRGVKARFAAELAAPDPEAKRKAFDHFVSPGDVSTSVLKHGMLAFWWPHQAELLAPFAREFLEVLPTVLLKQDFEYATRGFARLLFPHAVGDADLLERARKALADAPADQPILKRILMEECDELARVVALRSLPAT